MDPDCAICNGAASLRCDCEAKALETAISQAERRMMQSIYQEIRFVSSSAPTNMLLYDFLTNPRLFFYNQFMG
jgi:hypothetical protein